jgi:hypothetical protein
MAASKQGVLLPDDTAIIVAGYRGLTDRAGPWQKESSGHEAGEGIVVVALAAGNIDGQSRQAKSRGMSTGSTR